MLTYHQISSHVLGTCDNLIFESFPLYMAEIASYQQFADTNELATSVQLMIFN
jgi:hypothetical protein